MLAQGVLRMLDSLGLAQDPRARAAAADMLADLSRRELTEAVLDVDYVDGDGNLIEGRARDDPPARVLCYWAATTGGVRR